MRGDLPNLTRFVCRLHRRVTLLRALECAGVGLACTAVLSVLVLLPVLVMSNKPAMPVVAFLLPLGALMGVAWLLLRRPREIDAAGEADRQLDLADLLATAWVIARDRDSLRDPFARAVLLSAEARAASLSPASVVLNRLGARTWAGVGLSSALALTLALLSANPIASQAEAPAQLARNRRSAMMLEPERRSLDNANVDRSPPIAADHPNQEEDGFNPARRTTRSTGAAGDSPDHTETADPTGSGGGAGTSRSDEGSSLANAASSSSVPNRTGSRPGGGGGATSATGGADAGASGTSAALTTSHRPVPTWSTAAWPAARSAAAAAVRSGAVPAEYHDLIRAYFDREHRQP